VSRDDQILSLLKGIDRRATERHSWYSQTIKEHKEAVATSLKELANEITKLNVIVAEKNSETDKRLAVNELKFESFKTEIKREIAITRYGLGITTLFIVLVVSVLVSWYAKQPPQDVNPLAISKSITKLR
jgi:hypothetical protein